PIDLAAGDFLTLQQLKDSVKFSRPGQKSPDHPWWTMSPFAVDAATEVLPEERELEEHLQVRIHAEAVPSFQGNVSGAVDHVAARLREGWSVAIVAAGTGLV